MLHEDDLEIYRMDIAEAGFTVAAIVADESSCDWAYSIGLHRSFGHPELLVVGLDAPIAGAVIEVLGRDIAQGRRIAHADAVPLDGGISLRAREVDELWCALGDWFILGREVMAGWGLRWPPSLQLIWSDSDGRYPEHPGDPSWTLRQPLLSTG